ncbi:MULTISPECIES: COG3904 family protein [Mameliella]|uniref:COG3904 family protein n=1 Tax=Mameliella TaxID=1434019 RepID=UPI000B52DAEC|nr:MULTISPECIES: hypothetical protein [Mameliella]MCR9272825.1 hypothetical protein [Paracoccaceae bacterium]OWV57378.1 hypothetical protein CDZ98_15340 [Mameliella alba]
MRHPFLLCRFLAILALWLAGSATLAADFSRGGNSVMGCDVTLSGQITSGDAARMDSYLDAIDLPSGYIRTSVLCLDSPGGGYSEGIKLAEIISRRGLATAVGPGQRCESACALAFMAGRILAGDGYSEAKRRLHPAGQLGFHAPGLTVDNGTYTEQSVARAYEVAVLSVRELIEFRKRASLNFPETLLLEMLGTPPSRMRRIETVGDAALWKVEIFPVGNPRSGAAEMVWNACSNLQGYVQGSRPRKEPVPADTIGDIRRQGTTVTIRSGIGFLGEGQPRCQITLGGTGYVDKDAIGYIDFPEAGIPGSFTALYKTMLFAPDTRISDLPAPQQRDRENLLARFTTPRHSRGGASCGLTGQRARVTNVREYVNMRQMPDFDAPVMRRLLLGATVQVFGNPIITNLGGMRAACADACRPAGTGNLQMIRRCIDSNSIWINIMDSRGVRGFVSRQFLD